MIIDNFKFKNRRNADLAGRIYRKKNCRNEGVIFSHGLFSSKDGYKITQMAGSIIDSGFALMTFDFSFSGESPGKISEISVLDEVDDLESAINLFRSRGFEKIHLMGSSMGAAVTVLTASTGQFDIESLMLIATPLTFEKLVPDIRKDDLKNLDQSGYTSVSGVMVNNRFIREIFEIDMIDAVKKITSPVLLVHGRLDSVVDFDNHNTFIENCTSECTPLVIEDGDHNLTRDSDIKILSENVKVWLGKFNI